MHPTVRHHTREYFTLGLSANLRSQMLGEGEIHYCASGIRFTSRKTVCRHSQGRTQRERGSTLQSSSRILPFSNGKNKFYVWEGHRTREGPQSLSAFSRGARRKLKSDGGSPRKPSADLFEERGEKVRQRDTPKDRRLLHRIRRRRSASMVNGESGRQGGNTCGNIFREVKKTLKRSPGGY